MGKDRKKIDDEELSIVRGGIGNTDSCKFFLQAPGMSYVKVCDNCEYYNKDKDGNRKCSINTNEGR